MFGTQDCLIATITLTDLPGIAIDTDCGDVTYIHLLFDQHEVITANGAPCESLRTGPEAIKSIPQPPDQSYLPSFQSSWQSRTHTPWPRFAPKIANSASWLCGIRRIRKTFFVCETTHFIQGQAAICVCARA